MDRQQRALGDALRAALGGTRAQVEHLTADVARLEQDLETTRAELVHQRLLAEALEKELIRRAEDQPDERDRPQQAATGEPPGAQEYPRETGTDTGPVTAEESESLRGPSRRDCAIEELSSTGRTRPVRARDVALRYSPIYSKGQREAARTALNNLVAARLAIRLPDGTFLPTRALVPDMAEDTATADDPVVPPPRPGQTEAETAA